MCQTAINGRQKAIDITVILSRKNSMEKSIILLLSFTALFGTNIWALPVGGDECEVHFTFKLMSSDGEWESYVHYASEDGTAVMPDNNCEKVTWFQLDAKSSANETTLQIQRPVIVGTNTPALLGHQNGHYTDFFQVLTVTMTQMPNNMLPSYEKQIDMESKILKRNTLNSPPPKMCVFYIGAKGPGEPVLYVYGFQNANCTLTTPDVGPECILLAQ